jgi:hypothetical protein
MIYPANAKGPFRVMGYHDKDSKRLIGLIYRPDIWVANTVYYAHSEDDYAVIIPTVFKGLYFKANNPGKSGTTEPTWPTDVGNTVTDNGVIWEAVRYNLLPPTVDILTSTFVASDGVTLANPISTPSTTQVTITAVPASVTSFTITNHTIRNSGEEEDVTLMFKVAER